MNICTDNIKSDRLDAIDIVKGILIVLVVVGHLAIDDFFIYIIYSFHMPLFFGLAGGVIRLEKLSNMSMKTFMKKYFFRMIVPWAIAVSFYYVFREFHNFSIKGLISDFIHPFYHLWFIPAYMCYITLTWIMLKIKKKSTVLFGVVLSLVLVLSFYTKLSIETQYALINRVLKILKELHFYDVLFFGVGILLGEFCRRVDKCVIHKEYKSIVWLNVLTIPITVVFFFVELPVVEELWFYAYNLILLSTVLLLCFIRKAPSVKALKYIGQNTMPFYLYHYVGIMTLNQYMETKTILYYVVNLVLFVITYFCICLLAKSKLVNRYIFGAVS